MTQYIQAIKGLPAYVESLVSGHLILAALCLIVFVIALVMTNKVATICRYAVVIVCIAVGAFSFVFDARQLFCLVALILLLMILIRLMMYGIRTIRQNRIDRRIEERALAKAASRRGSWKNRQGYSGKPKPIESNYVPGKMSAHEINEVVKHEISESEHADGAEKAVETMINNE